MSKFAALFVSAVSLLSVAGCSQQVDEPVTRTASAVRTTSFERRASFLQVGAVAISTGEAFFKSVGDLAVTVDVSDYSEGGVQSGGYVPSPTKPGLIDLGAFRVGTLGDLSAWRRDVARHKASRRDVTIILYGLDDVPAARLQLHGALPSAHDARSASGASHGGVDDSIAFEFEGDEWQSLSGVSGVRLQLANAVAGDLAIEGVPGAWVSSIANVAPPIDLSLFFSPNGAPEATSFRAVLDVNGAAAAWFAGWGDQPRDLFLVPSCTQTGELACASVKLSQSQVVTSELSTDGRHVVELTNAGMGAN